MGSGTISAGAVQPAAFEKGDQYAEPADARKPTSKWRCYIFPKQPAATMGGAGAASKAPEATLHLHRQSVYKLGRRADAAVCDIPLDHESCAGAHAVLQYRVRPVTGADGVVRPEVKPYLMDLSVMNLSSNNNSNSSNASGSVVVGGTRIGGVLMQPCKYYEVLSGDTVEFGDLKKEFVFMKVD